MISVLCRPAPHPALTLPSFILLTKIIVPECQEFSCLAKSNLQSCGVFLPFYSGTFSTVESSKHSQQRVTEQGHHGAAAFRIEDLMPMCVCVTDRMGSKSGLLTMYLHCEAGPCLKSVEESSVWKCRRGRGCSAWAPPGRTEWFSCWL